MVVENCSLTGLRHVEDMLNANTGLFVVNMEVWRWKTFIKFG